MRLLPPGGPGERIQFPDSAVYHSQREGIPSIGSGGFRAHGWEQVRFLRLGATLAAHLRTELYSPFDGMELAHGIRAGASGPEAGEMDASRICDTKAE